MTNHIWLLDYGAGNVQSIINAILKATHIKVTLINSCADFTKADLIILPGVGCFGQTMKSLQSKGYWQPLLKYLYSGKPFFGICVGLQALFSNSQESLNIHGLNIIPFPITLFSNETKSVPHMGWNTASPANSVAAELIDPSAHYYFVHSYGAILPANHLVQDLNKCTYAVTCYGDQHFISAVRIRNIFAVQFHPEKSGNAGLNLLRSYFATACAVAPLPGMNLQPSCILASVPVDSKASMLWIKEVRDNLTKRIIACLDIRTNDAGQLVVTKGQGYDVREKVVPANALSALTKGDVRNLGDPIAMAQHYDNQGADEIAFLNITSYRSVPVNDLPMLELLRQASTSVFIPITIGGGVRDIIEPNGNVVSALNVVGEYFRAGADKVCIGSDAVYQAEQVWAKRVKNTWPVKSGSTTIEQISKCYGAQAVVISVDPRRIYVQSPNDTLHQTFATSRFGPNNERFCWYQCTVKGGREGRDFDVAQLVTTVEYLGAGEILLNCMDTDGSKTGYDLELIKSVKKLVRIPVIASSGAGALHHFSDVFEHSINADAALAAGIFHRNEVLLPSVKTFLHQSGISTRLSN